VLKPAVFYSIINLEEASNNGKKYQNLIQNFKASVLEKGIQEIKLEISLASASLEENINLFKILLDNSHCTQLNFASLYNAATYEQLNILIKTLLDGENAEIGVRQQCLDLNLYACEQSLQNAGIQVSLNAPKIKAYTPLTTNYIKELLKSRVPQSYDLANTLEIIPAIFNKKDLLDLKPLIGKSNNQSNSRENINNINSLKIFPCFASNSKELIDSLKNPIKELQRLPLSYNDNEGLEINNSQDLENLIELASSLKSATSILDNQRQPIQEIQIKNSHYPNRLTEISEMILSIWDINPEIHIICAGFNGASLEEIGSFYDKLIETLISKHKLTDKISIATRNNNFNEIQEFFKYSSI
jgi:hypothetical protein